MANLSEDIQCAGSDTRPPMLDRTDFASWQQRIRLYCRGKENGVNILKSIDEGPFQMGTFRETLAEGNEGALHLGPERARVYSDLSPEDKERFTKLINDMRNIKITMPRMQLNSKFVNNMFPEWGRFVTVVKLNRGLKDSNYDQLYAYLKQHEAHANENKMMLEQFTQPNVDPLALMSNVSHQQYYSQSSTTSLSTHVDKIVVRGIMQGVHVQLVIGELRTELGMQIQVKLGRLSVTTTTENRVTLDEEWLLFIAGGQDNAVDEDVDEQPVQDLALNVDNVFQADDYDVFDFDVDKAPTAQTMFMANLSSADHVYDEANLSYDSEILSEVRDHDNYQHAVCEHHEVHEMHDDVQPNYVVDSHTDYASDSKTQC
ncbi:hypothetical protein Tco_0196685 [Tanacetum coccineum]